MCWSEHRRHGSLKCMLHVYISERKKYHFNYGNSNRRRPGAGGGVTSKHDLQNAAGRSKQCSSRRMNKFKGHAVADVAHLHICTFLNLKQVPVSLIQTISTHNIKEALTGIYGVQQLIHMVLSEEHRRIRKQADLRDASS